MGIAHDEARMDPVKVRLSRRDLMTDILLALWEEFQLPFAFLTPSTPGSSLLKDQAMVENGKRAGSRGCRRAPSPRP